MAEQERNRQDERGRDMPSRPGAGIGRGPEDSGDVGTPRGQAKSGSGTHGRGAARRDR